MSEIDDLYLNIAKSLVQRVDEGWNKINVLTEHSEGSIEFDSSFTKENGEQVYFDIDFNTYEKFEELHSITTENPKNKWNRARFTLEPDGNFDIEFEWDQGLADEIERLSKED